MSIFDSMFELSSDQLTCGGHPMAGRFSQIYRMFLKKITWWKEDLVKFIDRSW